MTAKIAAVLPFERRWTLLAESGCPYDSRCPLPHPPQPYWEVLGSWAFFRPSSPAEPLHGLQLEVSKAKMAATALRHDRGTRAGVGPSSSGRPVPFSGGAAPAIICQEGRASERFLAVHDQRGRAQCLLGLPASRSSRGVPHRSSRKVQPQI